MKTQLCAAHLMNAEVSMLDLKTRPLEHDSIKWLKSWLESCTTTSEQTVLSTLVSTRPWMQQEELNGTLYEEHGRSSSE